MRINGLALIKKKYKNVIFKTTYFHALKYLSIFRGKFFYNLDTIIRKFTIIKYHCFV